MILRRPLGAVQELAALGRTVVAVPDGRPPRRSLIVVATDRTILAYWNVCRHLPVPLDAGSGSLRGEALVCGTHGARYRDADGYCFDGPCEGLSLMPVQISVEDGMVYAELESADLQFKDEEPPPG